MVTQKIMDKKIVQSATACVVAREPQYQLL